jgi:hypothetical protein
METTCFRTPRPWGATPRNQGCAPSRKNVRDAAPGRRRTDSLLSPSFSSTPHLGPPRVLPVRGEGTRFPLFRVNGGPKLVLKPRNNNPLRPGAGWKLANVHGRAIERLRKKGRRFLSEWFQEDLCGRRGNFYVTTFIPIFHLALHHASPQPSPREGRGDFGNERVIRTLDNSKSVSLSPYGERVRVRGGRSVSAMRGSRRGVEERVAGRKPFP